MNRYQLERKLQDNFVPNYLYNLYGTGRTDERLCLEKISDDKWQVYYEERGQKTSVWEFESEDEACRYIWEELKKERG